MRHTGSSFELLEGDSRSSPLPIFSAGVSNERPGITSSGEAADAASMSSAPQLNVAACSDERKGDAAAGGSSSGIDRRKSASHHSRMSDAMPMSGRSAWDASAAMSARSNGEDDAAAEETTTHQKSLFGRAANAAKYVANKGSPAPGPPPSNRGLARGKLQRSLHITRDPMGLPAVEPGIDPQTMESCNTIATKYGNPAVITGIKFDSEDIVCEYDMSLHELQGFLRYLSPSLPAL